jgi:uncharacterized protein YjaG (DUF416 family)
MAYVFSADNLSHGLSKLPAAFCFAFGIQLLERAAPNFYRFQFETGAQGGAMLRAVQSQMWAQVEGSRLQVPLTISSAECEESAPDTEQYSSLYTSSALDAISIACNLLEFVESKKIELIVNCASLRRDSLDIFLQITDEVDSDSDDFESELIAHPLMQEELGFQASDLDYCERSVNSGDNVWPGLLERCCSLQYSQFRMQVQRVSEEL